MEHKMEWSQEKAAAFTSLVFQPLEAAVGKVLLTVNYWILRFEEAEFIASKPNATGVAVVTVQFDTFKIDLTAGWERPLRGNKAHYHIQAAQSKGPGGTAVDTERFCGVSAAAVVPWRDAVGKVLTDVQVTGFDGSPRAIQFDFSGTSLVVVTGYSGSSAVASASIAAIGEGDELLVFSEQEWQSVIRCHEQDWESFDNFGNQ